MKGQERTLGGGSTRCSWEGQGENIGNGWRRTPSRLKGQGHEDKAKQLKGQEETLSGRAECLLVGQRKNIGDGFKEEDTH